MSARSGSPSHKKFVVHAAIILICVATAMFATAYPFLPGGYDPLATGLSFTVQVFGILGLLPAVFSIPWLISEVRGKNGVRYPSHRRRYATITVITGGPALLAGVLIAFLAMGKLGGALIAMWVVLGISVAIRFIRKSRTITSKSFCFAPFYIFVLSLALAVFQIAPVSMITDASRDRAIKNAAELIEGIENYHDQNGAYPESLITVNLDYEPEITGIDGYHYAKSGNSYNLFFQQPRFLLDDFGAKEFVVYNPDDRHTMVSHDGWVLYFSPEQLMENQGWYAAQNLEVPHWKAFIFD